MGFIRRLCLRIVQTAYLRLLERDILADLVAILAASRRPNSLFFYEFRRRMLERRAYKL